MRLRDLRVGAFYPLDFGKGELTTPHPSFEGFAFEIHLLRQEKATELECSPLHRVTMQICAHKAKKMLDTPSLLQSEKVSFKFQKEFERRMRCFRAIRESPLRI